MERNDPLSKGVRLIHAGKSPERLLKEEEEEEEEGDEEEKLQAAKVE